MPFMQNKFSNSEGERCAALEAPCVSRCGTDLTPLPWLRKGNESSVHKCFHSTILGVLPDQTCEPAPGWSMCPGENHTLFIHVSSSAPVFKHSLLCFVCFV